MQPLLKVTDIDCRYGSRRILESVSFTLNQGEICCLLGPSGCGKTTLLHAIAGFQPVYHGTITLSGNVVSSPGSTTPPEQRHIGMVFQDYALFPHLTVRQNIAFGLKSAPRAERELRADKLLKLIRMQSHRHHYPYQLSGGQQQRVALARSLAPRPCLLLMDEPFSNLDTELRRELAAEVRHILREEGTAAVIVTHDRSEAFIASDKMGVLADGQLQQWDTPQNLYLKPANTVVARIVGEGNLLHGKILRPGLAQTELGIVKLEGDTTQSGREVDLFVRCEDIVAGQHSYAINAQVVEKNFLGRNNIYKFRLPGGRLITATMDLHFELYPDSEVPLRIGKALVFAAES